MFEMFTFVRNYAGKRTAGTAHGGARRHKIKLIF